MIAEEDSQKCMFTIEQRDNIRNRLLGWAKKDSRFAAGAFVGSTASGLNRWSDLDLTFSVKNGQIIDDILSDWTTRLENDFEAVKLFDLPVLTTVYRVFLFTGNLQVDMSLTPEGDFGPRGAEFKLLFGRITKKHDESPWSLDQAFGLAVHHLVRARICLERNKPWQAEYWISAARDYALALACHHRGLKTAYGRGFDDLPREVLIRFQNTFPTPPVEISSSTPSEGQSIVCLTILKKFVAWLRDSRCN